MCHMWCGGRVHRRWPAPVTKFVLYMMWVPMVRWGSQPVEAWYLYFYNMTYRGATWCMWFGPTRNKDIFCGKVERMSRCVRSQKEMSDVRSSYLYIKYPIARTHLESTWLWLAWPWHAYWSFWNVYWSFWNINGPIDLKIRLFAHDHVVSIPCAGAFMGLWQWK